MGYEATLAAFRRGDNAEADRLARLDLRSATTAGDLQGVVDARCMLARTALREGRIAEVSAQAAAAFEAGRGQPRLLRMPLHLRAVAARMTGDLDAARELYQASIRLNDELGEALMSAAEHRNLAYVELRAGGVEEARGLFAEAARRVGLLGSSALDAYLTLDRATVALLDGDRDTAWARLADAEAQFAQLGVVPDPDDAWEMTALRDRLGDPNEP